MELFGPNPASCPYEFLEPVGQGEPSTLQAGVITGKGGYGCFSLADPYAAYGVKIMLYPNAVEEYNSSLQFAAVDPTRKYGIYPLAPPKALPNPSNPAYVTSTSNDVKKCYEELLQRIMSRRPGLQNANLAELPVPYSPSKDLFDQLQKMQREPLPSLGALGTILLGFHNLAEGLELYHKNNLLHSDIKLENLVGNIRMGEAKFIDFGLSYKKGVLPPNNQIPFLDYGTYYLFPPIGRIARHMLDTDVDISHTLRLERYNELWYRQNSRTILKGGIPAACLFGSHRFAQVRGASEEVFGDDPLFYPQSTAMNTESFTEKAFIPVLESTYAQHIKENFKFGAEPAPATVEDCIMLAGRAVDCFGLALALGQFVIGVTGATMSDDGTITFSKSGSTQDYTTAVESIFALVINGMRSNLNSTDFKTHLMMVINFIRRKSAASALGAFGVPIRAPLPPSSGIGFPILAIPGFPPVGLVRPAVVDARLPTPGARVSATLPPDVSFSESAMPSPIPADQNMEGAPQRFATLPYIARSPSKEL